MNRVRAAILALAVFAVLPAPGHAANTHDFLTVDIVGQKQGGIPGELTQKGFEKLWEVIAFNHEIVSPRDPSSGLPTGKRMHKPLKLVLKIGTSTPQLMSALVNNENLTKVELKLYRPDAKGQRTLYLTITLTNANISDISSWLPNRLDPANDSYVPLHEVSFTYQKIEWTTPTTSASDDWLAPQA